MSAFAFAAEASNPWIMAAPRSGSGSPIPALIFAFMRLGAALWFDCQNRLA